MATPTKAVFTTRADAEKYLKARNDAAGLPKLEGVPGGGDPTGRRHLYPAQTLTVSLEDVQAAADGTAFAVSLDEKIDPGAKATKVEALTGEKWAAAAIEEAAAK